ncbi:hypothetical protein A1OQ_20580 [Enterovibrio norvegicus FF-162]|uniref:hypothetical protein n=1 Tax=Enterovibrio norvegicus TaxID=188144 RepID=UPI0002D6C9C5|nr:hypothetical protein [Enterovibrio norvegicus]OEE81785.1 hypothetical protein A1OQ_20580 [Enterovibrio norvegicus FF-162]
MNKASSLFRFLFDNHLLVLVVFTLALIGCETDEDKNHKDEIHNEAAKPTPWWEPLDPDVVIGSDAFYAGECSILSVKTVEGVATETVVFRAPSRPLTTCKNGEGYGEPLKHDGKFIILSVCRMAFGAGGCAVERYRSADLQDWEEHIGVTWIDGEEYEAWRTLGSTSSKADSVKKVKK